MVEQTVDQAEVPWRHLGALIDRFVNSATSLEHDMLRRIASSVSGFETSAFDDDLHAASCSAHVEFIRDPTGVGASHGPYRIGADGADRGVPLAGVLSSYRLGAQVIWEQVAAYALLQGATVDGIVQLASEVWLMHDRFAEILERGWRDADQARVARAQRERASLVDQVVGGAGSSPAQLWDAVSRLGLPRAGRFVVAVVEVVETGVDPLPEVESRLASRGVASAWLMRAGHLVGLVVVSSDGEERGLLEVLGNAQVTGGVSPSIEDWAEAHRGLRLASAASAAAPVGRVVRFGDLPVATSVASSPDVSRELAKSVLAGVLELPDRDRVAMLTTVRTWFSAQGSIDQTAVVLELHPNSVRNRLKRFESLVGRSLAVPGDLTEIAVALTVLELR